MLQAGEIWRARNLPTIMPAAAGVGESERTRLRSACVSQAPRRTQGTLYFPFRKKGWPASGYKNPGLWEGSEWNEKQGRERDRQM